MALFGRKRKQEADVVEEVPAPTLPIPPEPDGHGRRPVAAHRDYILSLIEELPPFGMQLLDAVGLSLCEDLEADQDIPAVNVAQCEGYAVIAADVTNASPQAPVRLPIELRLKIGQQASGEAQPGGCVAVVAGSPMPSGTNAVVPSEFAVEHGDEVDLMFGVQPGQYVREVGRDIGQGQTLLRKGDLLDARTVGMLAGAGVSRVMARPRPRVIVLAVGSELVEPGGKLRVASDVYDVNSYLLAAAATRDQAQVFRVGLYTNDREKIRETITDQLIRADLIISTGGVSRDGYDLVRSLLPEMGLTDFCEVAMNPGTEQGFALVGEDRVPMMMLPGNPISAYVSYQAFVRPVIRKLMGTQPYVRKPVRAITRSLIRSNPEVMRVVRGRVDEELGGRRLVEPFVSQASHQLGDLAQANCLILLPPGTEMVPAGDPVQVWMLDDE